MLDENITGGLLNESMMLVDNTEERVTTNSYLTCSLVLRPLGGPETQQDVEFRTLNFELTKLMRDSDPPNLGLVPRRFFLADRKVWSARLWLTQVAT